MTAPAIVLRGLSKSFRSSGGAEVRVLDGLDLEVARGEFVCILGPTGCGKTTLLRLVSGLLEPTGGEARLERRRSVGMVFQQNSLLPFRRVLPNVAFPLELAGVPRREARERARELLRLVRLTDVERAWPYELSGGMQQRAAIARALAAGGDLLLMDEPFGALDEQTRLALQQALLEIQAERRLTVLFVTHHIEEALLLADRVLVLGQGRILAEERVALDRPRDRFAPDFVAALVRLRRLFAEAVG